MWGNFVAYSKICTHAGCPASLYEQQTNRLLCPCHQSQFLITDNARPIFGPASRRLPQLPIERGRRGLLRRRSRTTPSPSGRLLGAAMKRRKVGPRKARCRARPRRAQLDDRFQVAHPAAQAAEQGLPGPLVVPARRDRAVLVHRAAADRHLPDAFFDPSMAEVGYNGSYAPLRGIEMSGPRTTSPGHLVRRPRRPGHAADAPLGGAAVHGRDRRAHAPGLLHRRVPQAA